MNKVLESIKKIDYRLFFALIILALMPTIYLTVRVNFLGNLPGDWGFNIASQLSWVHLLYEIVQEALILPLFFIMGKSLFKKDEFENKVRTGLLFTFNVYFFLSIIVFLFARPLVLFMAQQDVLVDATVNYIRLETFASIFLTLAKFITLVLVTMKKDKYLYIILAVQMVMTILLDTFLISNLSFSLNLGVNGIAITNIIVNIILLAVAFGLLSKENIFVFNTKLKMTFSWMKEWFKVGLYSGIESFVRNLAFMIMIIRMINVVAEQGAFWNGNNFIWGWLLLPILALGDLIKKEVAEDKQNISKNTLGYFTITTIIVVIWLISIPFWKPFLNSVMNLSDYEKIFNLILVQLFFYIVFAYNNVMDSTFYGVGKTEYMLYQSLIVNIIFYGGAFILYTTGVFVPTLTGVALMFGLGMLFDMIPTAYLYFRLLKKESINILIFSSKNI